MKPNFKWVKKLKEYLMSPASSYICSDCGEEVIFLGPGMPSHKCDITKVVEKKVLEMKLKGMI